jgi:hypothetical protein
MVCRVRNHLSGITSGDVSYSRLFMRCTLNMTCTLESDDFRMAGDSVSTTCVLRAHEWSLHRLRKLYFHEL